jgi:hypothetical protein
MKKAVELYRSTLQHSSSTKSLDARLLGPLCVRLEEAIATQDAFAQIQVMGDLRQAWLTYQTLLSDAEHPYPVALRRELLDIAALVLDELMRDASDADLPLVLALNRQLLKGLTDAP